MVEAINPVCTIDPGVCICGLGCLFIVYWLWRWIQVCDCSMGPYWVIVACLLLSD